MGAQGLRAVAEELSWNTIAARMEAAYARVIASPEQRAQLVSAQ
jgi:hypothetical protein